MWNIEEDLILEYFYRNLYTKNTMCAYFNLKLPEIKKRLCIHYKKLLNKGLSFSETSAIIGISKREYFNLRKCI